MYTRLKKIGFHITPKWMRRKIEPLGRSIIALSYRGTQYQCNLCNYRLRQFVQLSSGDLLCPRCGSLGRTRGLWAVIKDRIDGKKVLHFSPPKSLRTKLAASKTLTYISSDYMGEFASDKQYDLCNIAMEDNATDVILCFHVLEHIEDDQLAMSELYRILVPGGQAYIQTPFKSGEIYEDLNLTSPEDRKIHFGQEDHVRIYSPEGLKTRLQNQGFDVEIIRQKHEANHINGLKADEIILIASK